MLGMRKVLVIQRCLSVHCAIELLGQIDRMMTVTAKERERGAWVMLPSCFSAGCLMLHISSQFD